LQHSGAASSRDCVLLREAQQRRADNATVAAGSFAEGLMSKLPATRRSSVREVEDVEFEVIEPKESTQQGFGAFSSFRYSYTEISASGGKARVRSQRTSFEDGKLVSESFEADLGRGAYDQMASQAQQLLQNQMRLLLQPLSWFLPFSGRRGPQGE
jgi:hypothetical protein